MSGKPTSHRGKANKAGSTVKRARTLEDYAREFEETMDRELPISLGFSARLNMLWDLANAAPPQTEGRVISVMGINRDWREADVRKWLQKDVLPPRLDLHNMVKFLVAQLGSGQDVRRWEAFLIYGSPIVSSPVNQSTELVADLREEPVPTTSPT